MSLPEGVQLFSASEERGGLTFEFLHRKDLSPIRTIRLCAEEDREVPFGEVVRGYWYRKGKYVLLEEDDFRRVRAVQTRSLAVVGFCSAEEISRWRAGPPKSMRGAKGKRLAACRQPFPKGKRKGGKGRKGRNRSATSEENHTTP